MVLQYICIFLPSAPCIWYDNISAFALALNPMFHPRTKPFEVDSLCLQCIVRKDLTINIISSANQLVDHFTKDILSIVILWKPYSWSPPCPLNLMQWNIEKQGIWIYPISLVTHKKFFRTKKTANLKKILLINSRNNYSKLTCGMTRFHFAYLWFKILHFAHLNFNLLPISYPPHPQMLEKHLFIQNQNITRIKNTNHWIFSSQTLETRKSLVLSWGKYFPRIWGSKHLIFFTSTTYLTKSMTQVETAREEVLVHPKDSIEVFRK